METSQDFLLKGRVSLCQPLAGYRAGIDPVCLAASVPVKAGERVLDVGCGVGAAALCLAARVPDCAVTGLEREGPLVELARQNARNSGFGDRVHFVEGNLFDVPESLKGQRFDHVVTNPPFVATGHTPSQCALKRKAHHEEETGTIEAWLKACLRLLKEKGTLTLIHRTDRLDQILAFLWGRVGDLRLLPLWSKEGLASKRFILMGRKGVRSPLVLLPGLVVHTQDGSYTTQAKAVLEEAAALPITQCQF